MATDIAMTDMDIDMSLENDDDPEIAQLRAAAAELDAVRVTHVSIQ